MSINYHFSADSWKCQLILAIAGFRGNYEVGEIFSSLPLTLFSIFYPSSDTPLHESIQDFSAAKHHPYICFHILYHMLQIFFLFCKFSLPEIIQLSFVSWFPSLKYKLLEGRTILFFLLLFVSPVLSTIPGTYKALNKVSFQFLQESGARRNTTFQENGAKVKKKLNIDTLNLQEIGSQVPATTKNCNLLLKIVENTLFFA